MANARLIAAAPQLLAELKKALARVERLEDALDQCIWLHTSFEDSLEGCNDEDEGKQLEWGGCVSAPDCVRLMHDVTEFFFHAPELAAYLREKEKSGGQNA